MSNKSQAATTTTPHPSARFASRLARLLSPEASATTSETTCTDATELSARERWRRAFAALTTVLADPEKTDQVLVFSTYANAGTMKDRIHYFLDDPRGHRLYEERRTIDTRSIDLAALGRLPEGTLGRAYADFLGSRGLSPDVFEHPPEEVRDPATAYIIMRLRQTHDLWHVVTGFDTDPASEVALQAFTYGQLRAPSSGILAVLGTLRGMSLKPTLALDVAKAYRVGRRAERLGVFPWEDYWSTPLSEVRAMLKLPIVPRDAERLGREVRVALAAIAETNATTPSAVTNATTPSAVANATTPSAVAETNATTPSADTRPAPSSASPTPDDETASATSAEHAAGGVGMTAASVSRSFIEITNDAAPHRSRRTRRAIRRAFRAARAA